MSGRLITLWKFHIKYVILIYGKTQYAQAAKSALILFRETTMQGADLLPNVMYFGASKAMTELKDQVFLTPHIGIASLFIIDTDDLFAKFPKGYRYHCNIAYRQWNYPDDRLAAPLQMVNAFHNIAELANEYYEGQSSGTIHVVDISGVKDRLLLFTTNDPNREVVYHGDSPLAVIRHLPHTVRWDFCFSGDDVQKHGPGTAIKM